MDPLLTSMFLSNYKEMETAQGELETATQRERKACREFWKTAHVLEKRVKDEFLAFQEDIGAPRERTRVSVCTYDGPLVLIELGYSNIQTRGDVLGNFRFVDGLPPASVTSQYAAFTARYDVSINVIRHQNALDDLPNDFYRVLPDSEQPVHNP